MKTVAGYLDLPNAPKSAGYLEVGPPQLPYRKISPRVMCQDFGCVLAYPYTLRKPYLLIPTDLVLSSRSGSAAGDWGICGRFLTKTSISRPGLGTGITYHPINTAAWLNPSPSGRFPVNGRAMGRNR